MPWWHNYIVYGQKYGQPPWTIAGTPRSELWLYWMGLQASVEADGIKAQRKAAEQQSRARSRRRR